MEKKLRIAGIINDSIVDGPGIRLTIFTQGCSHHCKGCHNPETWPFNLGNEVEVSQIIDKIKSNPLLQGITLSGGDPVFQSEACVVLCKAIKEFDKNLDICMYTGFTYEKLLEMSQSDKNIEELLGFCDFIVDGPYVEELRDLTLHFRGSKNQRFIDVNETRRQNKIITKY